MRSKIYFFILGGILLFLFSCSASDAYSGEWFALGNDANKVKISFIEKKMILEEEGKAFEEYNFTQNSVGINNGIKYYGLRVEDIGNINIIFPSKKNKEYALIIVPAQNEITGNSIFTMQRNKYPDKFHTL